MRHSHLLLAALVCVSLDSGAPIVLRQTPQRVESVTEYRWCRDGTHRSLRWRRYWAIEGASGPVDERDEILWQNAPAVPEIEPPYVDGQSFQWGG